MSSNPFTNAPMEHVIDDVWLIDDTAFTPAEKFVTKFTAEQARENMRIAIQNHQTALAGQMLTNSAAFSGQRRLKLQPGMKRIWYAGREIQVSTNANIGLAIQSLELDYPGISTNFSSEQLKIPPPSTNQWWKTAKQLPPHIIRSSPTFKEDLEKWKLENLPNYPGRTNLE